MCWQWTRWVIYRIPLNYIMTGLNLFYKTIRPYLIKFHNSFFITRNRKRHRSLFIFQMCDLWKALVYNSSWHHGLTHESLIFFTFKFGRSKWSVPNRSSRWLTMAISIHWLMNLNKVYQVTLWPIENKRLPYCDMNKRNYKKGENCGTVHWWLENAVTYDYIV